MSLSPLQQQQQQQQQQVLQLLNFNQLTVQTNDYSQQLQQQHNNIASTLFGGYKQTTSPLNNLLNASPIINNTHQQQQQQQQQQVQILNHHDEDMSTSSSSSSSASSTHSISSSSNSSIKDEQHLLTLSPMMMVNQQHQQRNINTLLSSASTQQQQQQQQGIMLNDLANNNMANKCDLCKDLIINNTKLLWGCYHTYCSSCIDRLQQHASSSSPTSSNGNNMKPNKITCPLCSQEIRIVDTGLQQQQPQQSSNDIGDYLSNDLGYNFSLVNLLSENKHKLIQEQQRCQSCKSNDSLMQKCFCCSNHLCQNCLLTHQYINHFEMKDMILDSPLLSQQQQNERLVNCYKHKNEQTKYFCLTCNQLLCKECTFNEPHQLVGSGGGSVNMQKQHEFGLINEIGLVQMKKLQLQLDNYKMQLQGILSNDNNNNLFNHQNHNHHQQHHNEHNLEQLLAYLNTKYQKALSEIDNMHHFYKQLLDERKQELKNELDSIYSSKQLLISNLQLMNKNDENLNNIKFKIDNIINFTQKLMKNSSTSSGNGNSSLNELLLVKKPLEQKLQLWQSLQTTRILSLIRICLI